MQMYTKDHAELIIESRKCEFDIGDDGLRPSKVSETNAEFDSLLNWTPHCELDAEDAPDPLTEPALPFPFTENQLAAFLVHGRGYFVRERYGEWEDGPDTDVLDEFGTQAVKVRQALRGAFDAYRNAESVVGAYDKTYSEEIQILELQFKTQCGPWRDIRERIKQAHRAADHYEAAFRKLMVNQLLAVTASADKQHLSEANTVQSPAQSPATPAPVVPAGASGGVEPDKAGPVPVEQGLSTKEIADAFDGVNGWSADRWTKNLSASKWLHPARIAIGGAGGASSVWSPVMLAQLMHDNAKGEREKEKLMKVLNSRFTRSPVLGVWRDAFNEYFATHCTPD